MENYIELGLKILSEGNLCEDRTGIGTSSLFGEQLRFDLRKGFPLITTKKVTIRPMVRELLWFLRGETNIKTLGSKIWDEWAQPDGELGPIYSKQWTDWNGINQIQEALDLIKHNPNSRRIIVNAWNVSDLDQMALPPCHCFFQFRVYGKFLDMQLYQRSADYAVGVPYNIASYALLLSMFANECGLVPRHFVHTFGDVHLYRNHFEKFEKQIKRPTHDLCKLSLTSNVGVFDIEESDIVFENYYHEKYVKYEIAV